MKLLLLLFYYSCASKISVNKILKLFKISETPKKCYVGNSYEEIIEEPIPVSFSKWGVHKRFTPIHELGYEFSIFFACLNESTEKIRILNHFGKNIFNQQATLCNFRYLKLQNKPPPLSEIFFKFFSFFNLKRSLIWKD